MNYNSYFKGKKITVMGLGLLGRGVGDIAFLAASGAELIVTDLKSKEDLKESLAKLSAFNNITYVLGEHRLEDFRDKDFILKAAGVPLDSVYIAEARKNNIPIEMSTALFAALTEATLVGITGTRGKSTTTHLIHEILVKAYKDKKEKIFLGGNVRGVSTLALLPETKKGDVVVLELDSWQLQGFGERKISPQIAVFTTFMPDHLNYYKGNLDLYFNDKANIFLYQKSGDTLIYGKQIIKDLEQAIKQHQGSSKAITADHVPQDWEYKIPGEHNRLNIALAREAALALGIKEEIIREAVAEYKGVKGRLEFIKKFNGISIYNDTTATTPDATLTGLKALGTYNKVILIMGGSDKHIDMNRLLDHIAEYTKDVILIPGTGSDRIRSQLQNINAISLYEVETLEQAVNQAISIAKKDDAILFSPAFASFGMFKNEFDRGDTFNSLIDKLG